MPGRASESPVIPYSNSPNRPHVMNSFILPLDKPVGPTSHDIIAMARRALGTRRIGHTGTLDPFASGLLLLCVNQATRLAEYMAELRKTYRAVARFDGSTTTDDHTGSMITTSTAWQSLTESALRAAFERQRGTIAQRPTTYSAKKVGGERAYDLARRGNAVDLAPVMVTIYDIKIVAVNLPAVVFEVECSSGTYVRAIARDVGNELHTGGYLRELRRTRIGPFDVTKAIRPEDMTERAAVESKSVSLLAALEHLPRLEITEPEQRAIRFGQSLQRPGVKGTVVLEHGGELVAIGLSDGDTLRPKKVFA